jgi:hypothetical protein
MRVEQYISDAIQPFVTQRIGSHFRVEATRIGKEQIDALVRIYRGPLLEIELRYQILWDEIEIGSQVYNIGQVNSPESAPLRVR